MNNLEIYNKLRDMHNILKDINYTIDEWIITDWKRNAIDAVGSVLYLAESIFSIDEKLKKKVGK